MIKEPGFVFSGSNYLCSQTKIDEKGFSNHSFEPIYYDKFFKWEFVDFSAWWSQEKFWKSRDKTMTLSRYEIIKNARNSVPGAHPEGTEGIDKDLYSIMFKNIMGISSIHMGTSFSLTESISESEKSSTESPRSLLRAMVLQIAFELNKSIQIAKIQI